MTTSIQPREEVFPGYHLTERLGSGGYAEVWRARAPGEIEKAVKIVFGCYDEQLAVQEWKALERIKNVRHPFVLSLERFEIVDGRLAILTELADMSLEQRAQQCRARGLPGIPREELMRFISDAAEALDFLADRHNLQHLDIKPANLLISGEHVKVADFGLVKELASRTQNSIVAGMTPTYSSPEMFDDAPSPHSDQYSLAIAYQEMLTGVLPFPGRTTAQLANQHLHSPPQLATLTEIDRPAVARALAKNPAERFPSCRAFVKALQGAVESVAMRNTAANDPNEPTRSPAHESSSAPGWTKRLADKATTASSDSLADDARSQHPNFVRPHSVIDTEAEVKHSANTQHQEEMNDMEVPKVAATVPPITPTLYIAVGGVGIRILCQLRDSLARRANAAQPSTAVEMIAIDTDRAEIKNACSPNWSNPLSSNDALYVPLKLPQVYREQGSQLDWLSHRWLYNIPRSLETRGYRPLGRLAVVDHVDRVLALVDRKLDQLAAISSGDADQSEAAETRVVLLVGMGGGTGSGMAIDLANAVRWQMQKVGRRGQIQGVLVCTCLENTNASPMSVANTYALLTELQFVSAFGNQGPHSESNGLRQLESQHRPFDLVYVAKALPSANHSGDDGLASIALQMALASTEGAGQMLRSCQQAATPRELAQRESLLLRTFGSALLAGPQLKQIDRLAKSLAQAIQQKWLASASPSDWRRLDSASDPRRSLVSDSADTANVAPNSPKSPVEELRRRFGRHSSTQFAYEIVSHICRPSPEMDSDCTRRLSAKDPARFIELTSQAISSISIRAAESPKLGEPLSEEEESIVAKLAAGSHCMLTKIIDEIEQVSAEFPFEVAKINCKIAAECVAAVKGFLGRGSADLGSASNAPMQTGAQQLLAKATVDWLQCGYDRRTLIFLPATIRPNETIDALTKARPATTVVSANVDEAVVYCEGAGLNPSSLARGFERVYPGIAEAASRLFTRIDIDWSKWTR